MSRARVRTMTFLLVGSHTVAGALAAPVGTAFTYQAQLTVSGSPADGAYDLQFDLYDDPNTGLAVGSTVVADDVSVTDGTFTVEVDFGVDPWTGDQARWLEIAVRDGASTGPYTTLSPRQKVTPTPFSLATRGLNVDASGNVDLAGDIHTTAKVLASAYASTSPYVMEAPAGTERARIDDTTGYLGIAEPSPLAPLHVTASNLFGTTGLLSGEDLLIEDDGVCWIGLYSDDDASSIVGGVAMVDATNGNKWAMYRRTTSNVGDLVFTYGTNSNPGANTKMMQIRNDGDVLLAPETGNVGIGLTSPGARLHAYVDGGVTSTAATVARIEERHTLPIGLVVHRSLDFTANSINSYDIQNGGGASLHLNAASGGDVGIGDNSPQARLHVTNNNLFSATTLTNGEDLLIEDDGAAWIGLYSDDDAGGIVGGIAMVDVDNGNKWAMYRRPTSNVGDLVFTYGNDVNPGANTTIMRLKADGTTVVDVLEVTGADVAERFPVSEKIEPGMVVEIDPDRPGRLRLARGAYNQRVAGVVSGAGDLPVGAILGNLPGEEETSPVALSGRVWAYADATEHAIQPGDLLTTAARPGYAMAVRDRARATGATLGKAMTALKQGEDGLVLVLVNLQ